uniref:Uncharacterized protein n=1 Tax=Rhizophora mucronata TaxID=61149 RepID=A0A2P2QLJ1_RHIMU
MLIKTWAILQETMIKGMGFSVRHVQPLAIQEYLQLAEQVPEPIISNPTGCMTCKHVAKTPYQCQRTHLK